MHPTTKPRLSLATVARIVLRALAALAAALCSALCLYGVVYGLRFHGGTAADTIALFGILSVGFAMLAGQLAAVRGGR